MHTLIYIGLYINIPHVCCWGTKIMNKGTFLSLFKAFCNCSIIKIIPFVIVMQAYYRYRIILNVSLWCQYLFPGLKGIILLLPQSEKTWRHLCIPELFQSSRLFPRVACCNSFRWKRWPEIDEEFYWSKYNQCKYKPFMYQVFQLL